MEAKRMQQTPKVPHPRYHPLLPFAAWVTFRAFLKDHLVVPKHSSQVAFVMPLGFCCSFAKLGLTLCDPLDCSIPGFTVHHLPEFAQIHVHDMFMSWYYLIISSSAALFSFGLQSFQHQGLFHWVGSSQVAKVFRASATFLPMNSQGWFPLGLTGLISLQSKELSRGFSSTTIPKHLFFSAHPSLCPTLTSVHDY